MEVESIGHNGKVAGMNIVNHDLNGKKILLPMCCSNPFSNECVHEKT